MPLVWSRSGRRLFNKQPPTEKVKRFGEKVSNGLTCAAGRTCTHMPCRTLNDSGYISGAFLPVTGGQPVVPWWRRLVENAVAFGEQHQLPSGLFFEPRRVACPGGASPCVILFWLHTCIKFLRYPCLYPRCCFCFFIISSFVFPLAP